jgi:nucleolar protein 12
MLPRKLRVSRAKAIKRNAKPGASVARPPTHTRPSKGSVYNPKMTSEESSKLGRAGKLFGRAHAAQLRSGDAKSSSGIRGPETFIFEGHRASSKGGKTGLKLGGKKKGAKPGGRSAKRGAAWKSGGGKK